MNDYLFDFIFGTIFYLTCELFLFSIKKVLMSSTTPKFFRELLLRFMFCDIIKIVRIIRSYLKFCLPN